MDASQGSHRHRAVQHRPQFPLRWAPKDPPSTRPRSVVGKAVRFGVPGGGFRFDALGRCAHNIHLVALNIHTTSLTIRVVALDILTVALTIHHGPHHPIHVVALFVHSVTLVIFVAALNILFAALNIHATPASRPLHGHAP
eukprot:1195096-Prorocentrum_minimum.AAC.3